MAEVGFEKQLKTAMRQLRKEKIGARLNIMECCRSCVGEEKLNVEEGQPVVWHYGGQGSRVAFDVNGIPFTEDRTYRWRSSEPEYEPEVLYFNHANGAGERAVLVFKENGLNVVWDKSDGSCIQIIGPSKEEAAFLRCQAEAYREHEYWLAAQARKLRKIEQLRREADELEASMA